MPLLKVPKSGTMFTGYVVYVPEGYDPNKKYIGILFAHGIGEKGDGSENGLTGLFNFIGNTWQSLHKLLSSNKYVLVAPQLSNLENAWSNKYFDEAHAYLTSKYTVGTQVSVFGVSLGGQLVWPWCASHPLFVSNIVACCCVWVQANFANIKAPTLAYHAKDDTVVSWSNSKSAVDQINAGNPPVPAKYIEYPTGNHWIWDRVFSEPDVVNLLSGGTASVVNNPAPVLPNTTTMLKADAGPDITVSGSTATLDSSKSTGNITWRKWEIIDPTSEWNVFKDFKKDGIQANLINLKPGTYTFKLTVFGEGGTNATDEVRVTVGTATTPTPTKTVFATADIPAGKTKVTVNTDKSFEFS